jgi:hypothetical protein
VEDELVVVVRVGLAVDEEGVELAAPPGIFSKIMSILGGI